MLIKLDENFFELFSQLVRDSKDKLRYVNKLRLSSKNHKIGHGSVDQLK